MNDEILRLKNLSKTYYTMEKEILAIDDISFPLKKNSITAIIGPSGCGKSTLLNIIGELEKKTSGEVIFSGEKPKIGYMFQNDCLFPWLNILDNCLLGLKIKKEITKEKKEEVIRLLKDYGLGEFIYSYPANLSGGMKQRVALIRTLATNPDILLLDEPFSALDFETRLRVSDDVYRIIKKEKKTTVIITHDIEEAIAFSDHVIVLSKRPAKIKKTYDIHLTNTVGPIQNRMAKEFHQYYQDIWEVFDHEV